jgi:hypothetical protein
MTDLIELLTDCDARRVRLLPAGNSGLTIDAPQDALTSDLLARLKTHKAELLALLLPAPAVETQPMPTMKPTAQPVCRCGSTTWCDVPIHGGQSIRRDCSRCGRFLAFPIWCEKNTLQNE